MGTEAARTVEPEYLAGRDAELTQGAGFTGGLPDAVQLGWAQSAAGHGRSIATQLVEGRRI